MPYEPHPKEVMDLDANVKPACRCLVCIQLSGVSTFQTLLPERSSAAKWLTLCLGLCVV